MKYKRCCAPGAARQKAFEVFTETALGDFAARRRMENERIEKFGHVRPIVSASWNGYKFVAVGNRLHFDRKWRWFADFLFDYPKHVFGTGWGKKELAKKLSDRHPVMQWYQHVRETLRKQKPDAKGNYKFQPDGIVSAFLHLAYDLYVLRHSGKLQKEVIKRLRRKEHFQGALYELFVAATVIRAGLSIEYANERDPRSKHPEFIATDEPSNFVFAVEAKSKHRPGRLGFSGVTGPDSLAIKNLLVDAAQKETTHPFVIFIDVNLPHTQGLPTWVDRADVEFNEFLEQCQIRRSPPQFDLLYLTNFPIDYVNDGSGDPSGFLKERESQTSRISPSIRDRIVMATLQRGNIPTEFPDDFDQK